MCGLDQSIQNNNNNLILKKVSLVSISMFYMHYVICFGHSSGGEVSLGKPDHYKLGSLDYPTAVNYLANIPKKWPVESVSSQFGRTLHSEII